MREPSVTLQAWYCAAVASTATLSLFRFLFLTGTAAVDDRFNPLADGVDRGGIGNGNADEEDAFE